MAILDRINELGRTRRGKSELEELFASVLGAIDKSRKRLDMEAVFLVVGNKLLEAGIGSVISISSEKPGRFVIRHVSLQADLSELIPFEKGQEVGSLETRFYGDLQSDSSPIFSRNRTGDFFPNSNNQSGSIACPLSLRGELIGIMELISKKLEKKDGEPVAYFAKRLMHRISDIILYNEIKESEKRQRDIYENAKEGFVFVNGRERRFTDVNRAMTELTGYTRDEIANMDYLDLFHPEERERINSYVRSRSSIEYDPNTAPINYETRLLSRDKETKHVKITVARIINQHEWFSIIEDLTERKKAERALKRSEEKYRNLIDNASDAIIIFDIDGKIHFANSSFLEMTGYSREKLKNIDTSYLFSDEDILRIASLAREEEGDHASIDVQLRMRDGEMKFISISSSPALNGYKKETFQAILRDITETKLLSQKIQNAKLHYEQVIDTIQDGICVINKNFEIESYNKTFASKVNKPLEMIKGMLCGDVMPGYEKDLFKCHCMEKSGGICHGRKVFESGKFHQITEKNIDKDGKVRYHRFSLFPAKGDNGQIERIVITISDVTERKIAQERIRQLSEFNQRILDNSPVSIIAIDKTGKIIMMNSFAKKTMDVKEDMQVEASLLETKAIRNNPEVVAKYKRLLDKGEPFYYENISYIPKDGNSKVHLNIIAVPLFDEKKKVSGAISMAVDNTEAVQAKQRLEDMNYNLEKKVEQRTMELDKANKELAKVLELKSKFISDASHELRTPLTIIQGNLDLAIQEMRSNKEEIPEFHHLINKELGRMTKILSDLTTLTNADANTERLEYDLINMDLLINATSKSLDVLARQKNIKLKIDKNIPKNLFIWGDEARIEKLVLNVIRNAIKYTDKNGWVKISLRSENEKAVITIEDNGVGIPEEDLPNIFERFYRVDKSRSRAEGGTGLGLAICKWIAEAHRGSITVTSKLGKGSKFTISIPFDYRKGKNKDAEDISRYIW